MFCQGGFGWRVLSGGFCPFFFVRGVLSGGFVRWVLSGGFVREVLSGGFCPVGFVQGSFVLDTNTDYM